MTLIREFAPAKINLYLHVTGRRADGYHDLDSLVAFASIGDEIGLRVAEGFHLEVTGPQASALEGEKIESNLIFRAVKALAELMDVPQLDAHMVLVKNLPVASGIGGGSADAAAALRAMARHWNLSLDDPRVMRAAERQGQDVPACVRLENVYLTAAGIVPAPRMPPASVVLVNPGKGLPTPAVYKEYRDGGYPFSPEARFEKAPASAKELAEALKTRTNDLYAPACRLLPEIADVIAVLEASKECLLARMSGSGATCFGIYPDDVSAKSIAAQIRAQRPRWWVEAGVINA